MKEFYVNDTVLVDGKWEGVVQIHPLADACVVNENGFPIKVEAERLEMVSKGNLHGVGTPLFTQKD